MLQAIDMHWSLSQRTILLHQKGKAFAVYLCFIGLHRGMGEGHVAWLTPHMDCRVIAGVTADCMPFACLPNCVATSGTSLINYKLNMEACFNRDSHNCLNEGWVSRVSDICEWIHTVSHNLGICCFTQAKRKTRPSIQMVLTICQLLSDQVILICEAKLIHTGREQITWTFKSESASPTLFTVACVLGRTCSLVGHLTWLNCGKL